jgi:hypothetical protein
VPVERPANRSSHGRLEAENLVVRQELNVLTPQVACPREVKECRSSAFGVAAPTPPVDSERDHDYQAREALPGGSRMGFEPIGTGH